jgi:hypothetical protein
MDTGKVAVRPESCLKSGQNKKKSYFWRSFLRGDRQSEDLWLRLPTNPADMAQR